MIGAVRERTLTPVSEADLSRMLRIRHFEKALLRLFEQGRLNGTTHTCLGQEHVPVAVSGLLKPHDHVFSNHRGHGHFLARYDEPHALLAEITGREGALCNGVGGSQHIYHERFLSTGVQGESLPVAVGVALKHKRTGDGIACAYIGDGTWGEGSVYEALNMAQVWGAPLLVVVEHNRIAQSTPTTAQMAGTIAGRCAGFGVLHHRVESVDVNVVRSSLEPLLRRIREEKRPAVFEVSVHRAGPHSKGDDTRTATELAEAAAGNWYAHYLRDFPAQVAAAEEIERAFIDAAVENVLARPLSEWS
ncbi:thiamine pyrophosphate-dependent dehydrogenase E1 component subunit alpha [Herbidospora mongoliensis]|uniref:thiamine pyrophosphate-dependent dehydrogenase E1 component subunit alpha n=1 Tax=Herbidospora mongoliensis TaxID=688067 RepID=UPI000832F11A|nr:thiamine pyrophosphate-dependent dehydrogenase E1 component subunit alpha [Herbidospora mongoliensis]